MQERCWTMGTAGLLLAGCMVTPVCGAQGTGWLGVTRQLSEGSDGGVTSATLAGTWSGGKTQNDPVHGGFLVMEFRFSFMSNGTYQETATMAGRQVMTAAGTYTVARARKQDDRSMTNRLEFMPTECRFASEALEETVKLFPIPKDRVLSVYIGLGSAEGGSHMTLEDMSQGGDSWSLKPVH